GLDLVVAALGRRTARRRPGARRRAALGDAQFGERLGLVAERTARRVVFAAARVDDLRRVWQAHARAEARRTPAGLRVEREQPRVGFGKARSARRAGALRREQPRLQRA